MNFKSFDIISACWIIFNCSWTVLGNVESSIDLLTDPVPRFTSKTTTYQTIIGDTVVLPCETEDLGGYLLLWKRGNAVISVGDLKVSIDPRVSILPGFNLEIRKVRISDAGEYICQMNTLVPQEQIYHLEVLVPPSIATEPNKSQLTIIKGDEMTLECRANGNPTPSIKWTRKNNLLPNGEQSINGNFLHLKHVGRHHAGVYVCSAMNGVGTPVTTFIHVKVEYPPEIEVERNWVHSGEGYESELACIVHADPPATVRWYRDTLLLHTSDRRLIEERGSRHYLILRKVHHSDFGNYSCEASNKLGRSKKHMELTGKPNQPTFLSEQKGKLSDSFNATWIVESYSPILEYRLLYRKALPNRNDSEADTDQEVRNEWMDIVIPGLDYHASGNSITHQQVTNSITATSAAQASIVHIKSYNIRNLESDTTYEAHISAKNRYGKSPQSEMYSFRTGTGRNEIELDGSPKNDLFSDPDGLLDIGSSGSPSPISISHLINPISTLLLSSIILIYNLKI